MAYFLYPGVQKLTDAEKENAKGILLKEVIGLPVGFAAYYGIGRMVQALAHPVGQEPPLLDAPQNGTPGIACAALACFTLYQHMVAQPMPVEDEVRMYHVQKPVGRWVFLTRQVMLLQAAHSLVSQWDPAVANTMSLIISGMGTFISVQYFTLVHHHPQFVEQCDMWKRRGVPFRELMLWLHLPGAVLGLADVAFCKDSRAVLQASPSVTGTLGFIASYAVSYVLLVLAIKKHSAWFVYEVMDPLGYNFQKWAVFAGVQTGILSSFVGLAYVAARLSAAYL